MESAFDNWAARLDGSPPRVSSFRLDRAVSVGLIHPVVRLLGRRSQRIPILMYHGIREGVGARHPYFETNTSPELFSRHLQYLHENGYGTASLNDVIEASDDGRKGGKRVVITFDDGFRDFYTHGFPRLGEYGFRATMFVATGLIGQNPALVGGKEYLSWDEVRELHAHGMQIGSHTVTHPELYRLSPCKVEEEISRSKETIEDRLGAPVASFSYPFAFPEHDREFVRMLQGLLEESGYENGVSTIIGTAGRTNARFFLPRLPVNSFDDLPFFRAKLEGAYGWLHAPQYVYKSFQSVASHLRPEEKGN